MKRTLVFSLSAAFLIIGIHQSFYHGVANSYFFFMFSVFFLFLLKFVKPEAEQADEAKPEERNETQSHPSKYKAKKRKRIGQ